MNNLKYKRIFGAIILFLIFSFAVFGQAQTEGQKLSLNRPLERQIRGGETNRFQFKVKAGQYARVEVEQKSIDVIVSLTAPDGKLVVEMDGKDGSLWREAVSCLAEKSGVYQVEIKAYGALDQSGSYTITFDELRRSAPNDQKRLKAEAHLSAGRKFAEQGGVKNAEAIKEYEASALLWRELGETAWEAITLTNLGWANGGLSTNDQAIAAHTRAMELFQKTKDRVGENKAANGLGNSYNDLSQSEKAREFYEKALIIRREIKDRRGEGNTLSSLGNVYGSLSNFAKARDFFEQALIIKRELKDRIDEGSLLFVLGQVYFRLAQYEKALNSLEQSLAARRKIKDQVGEAETLLLLGTISMNSAQFEKARNYFDESLRISREIKNLSGEGGALVSLGAVYWNLAEYEVSRVYSEMSLVVNREIKDRLNEVNTLINLGNVFNSLAQYEKAGIYFEQSLAISQEISHKEGEGISLLSLGSVYLYLAQYEKARGYSERSLVINREINYRYGELNTLVNLGNVHNSLSQYEKARDYYEQALVINREVKDRLVEGKTLLNLGTVYHNLAQYEKARGYYEQSLKIGRERKDRLVESISLANLGSIHEKLEQYAKARDYHEQTLKIYQEINDRRGEGRALLNLGDVHNKLAQHELARHFLQQSLAISREIKDRVGEGSTLQVLGEVSVGLSLYTKALDYHEQSLLIFRQIKSRIAEGEVYGHLLGVAERLKNPNLAIFYGKQAVNVFQAIRGDVKGFDQDSRASFLKDKEPIYRRLADVLIAEGRFPEAQAVLDLLKEEEFKQVARRSGEPLFSLPYSRAEEEAVKIVDRIAALGRELSELKNKPKESHTAADTKRLNELEFVEIPAANKAFRLATEALSTVAPNVKNALDLKMKDNIQNILPGLGKGVVALYTVIGKTTLDEKTDSTKINVGWILLVTPEFRKAYPIDTADLEQAVFSLREALRSPKYDPQPLARELYKKLFLQTSAKQKTTLAADLETYLGKQKDKTLMWSLDGVLRYVPMAALHDGDGYLVEKYRNVVFNTASLGSLKDAPKPNWEIVGLGVSTEGTVKAVDGSTLSFSALEGAETELNSIIKEKYPADAVGVFPGTVQINKDFTKEALFEGARTGKPVIHISSHFWFNPAREESSFLLLGNGGKLEVTEFQDYPNLFSAVDFLSLSACDTATGGNANKTGSDSNGKEIEGFAYVAQTLGAKSVMASLWPVSDTGTQELMLKFYQIRKNQPDFPKGEALRQAQLSLLRGMNRDRKAEVGARQLTQESNGAKPAAALKPFKRDAERPFGHPYYWSPFILIGNWL